MTDILTVLRRECIYIWYYFGIQFRQIFRYWILGMLIGSFISVFAKDTILKMLSFAFAAEYLKAAYLSLQITGR